MTITLTWKTAEDVFWILFVVQVVFSFELANFVMVPFPGLGRGVARFDTPSS